MTEGLSFIFAAALLLSAPGPTNTLLATAGAISGWRDAIRLLTAECLGYLISIGVIMSIVVPAAGLVPGLSTALRIATAIYLVYAASRLWKNAAAATATDAPLGFVQVFITTLLNPKAVILAIAILSQDPAPSNGLAAVLRWLPVLILPIVLTGVGWIAFGTAVQRRIGDRASSKLCCRAGAVALLVFAGMIFGADIVGRAGLLSQ